ncbi:MAG TPA: sigma-54 dependent transcriptional regulator [Planctomycetota bacterium]|nr:sigma-54 dependent transcriptional regulator [Planctomycetota bacterium]
MSTVLVVDDEPEVLGQAVRVLAQAGHVVLIARSGVDAVRTGCTRQPDIVLMDMQMEGGSGLDVLPRLQHALPLAPVILMTGHGSADSAIEAMRRGAFEYLVKPLDETELLALIARAGSTIGIAKPRDARAVAPDGPPLAGMVGRSPQMIEVCKTVGQAARSDVTVLIRGESGTGKELVARALHNFSARARRPFVTVNCAAIPETLLESELFGYEKGAFTGATARRKGRFEQADGGTIFLDEVGDMSPGTQAKVLRILQDRSCERLGGNETLRLDVRVLCATNRNLEQLVARGSFREDLYYRLKVLSIHLPPLRERKEDIPDFAAAFLARPRPGDHVPSLSSAALQRLMLHDWPGNVRELECCVEQSVVVCGNGVILPQHLGLGGAPPEGEARVHDKAQQALRSMSRQVLVDAPGSAYDRLMQAAERLVIAEALRRTRGNLSQASRLLGLSRPTLRAKVLRYGLDRLRGQEPAGEKSRSVAPVSEIEV